MCLVALDERVEDDVVASVPGVSTAFWLPYSDFLSNGIISQELWLEWNGQDGRAAELGGLC